MPRKSQVRPAIPKGGFGAWASRARCGESWHLRMGSTKPAAWSLSLPTPATGGAIKRGVNQAPSPGCNKALCRRPWRGSSLAGSRFSCSWGGGRDASCPSDLVRSPFRIRLSKTQQRHDGSHKTVAAAAMMVKFISYHPPASCPCSSSGLPPSRYTPAGDF